MLLSKGDNFTHLIQKRRSQLGFVTYLLNYHRIISLRSSSIFLRLLPRLPVTSIPPFVFPSITRCRRQFLRKMWPIELAFRLLISCRRKCFTVQCILVHRWWQGRKVLSGLHGVGKLLQFRFLWQWSFNVDSNSFTLNCPFVGFYRAASPVSATAFSMSVRKYVVWCLTSLRDLNLKAVWHIEDGAFKLFKCTFPGFNL